MLIQSIPIKIESLCDNLFRERVPYMSSMRYKLIGKGITVSKRLIENKLSVIFLLAVPSQIFGCLWSPVLCSINLVLLCGQL